MILLAAIAACAAALSPAPPVAVAREEVSLWRDAPGGRERMVTLELANPGPGSLTALRLETGSGRSRAARELIDIPAGGACDTIWVREPAPPRLAARLVHGDRVIWSGNLALPAPAARRVVVPRTPCVRSSDLKPLMLRGANYYPRRYPWPGLWREMDESRFEAEFRELDRLAINTIRTFYNPDIERGLHRADGGFTPLLLSRIDTLLRVANRHHMKVMLTIGAIPPISDGPRRRRYFRTGVEPFQYDGRVLLWDLINEPGGNEGPKATPELARWIQDAYADLVRLDPDHLRTVGLCWQFDQLWDLGVKPPVGQFHNYSGAVGVQPAGGPPVRNVADDLKRISASIDNRPLIIGEFGYATAPDGSRRDASEERQTAIYRGVIEGAEAAAAAGVRLVGVYNWTAFHFEPDWMGSGEQSFGVIRLDGALKPAGELLRATYHRWRERRRAPWEGR